MSLKSRIEKRISLIICAGVIFLAGCTFSVTPHYNANKVDAPDPSRKPTQITNRDDLKAKAIEQVKTLHRLLEEGKLEEAYQMIDDRSPLKLPKEEALSNLQNVVDKLGTLQKMDLSRDTVVEDKSLNGGQIQVRQEFIVQFEKDTPSPNRYELFNWNVYPGDTFKLWSYKNAKGDD